MSGHGLVGRLGLGVEVSIRLIGVLERKLLEEEEEEAYIKAVFQLYFSSKILIMCLLQLRVKKRLLLFEGLMMMTTKIWNFSLLTMWDHHLIHDPPKYAVTDVSTGVDNIHHCAIDNLKPLATFAIEFASEATLTELLDVHGRAGVDWASGSSKPVSKTPSIKFSIIKKSAPQSSTVGVEKAQQDAKPTVATSNVLQSLFQEYGSDEDE
ncbi:hypothetical protein SASPL_117287 [Salvia splendens]|uniref:Uncharacterized protein n=1 Tax=Salvia splendens TaxID=180675 RepID=A0A8X8ZYR9_SALSN|nr:hypothetical protein SASPL_117287 [Salvia splendens]